jgi:hypothetical protein
MYTRINEKIDSHITEIRRAFWRSVPFLKDFWEPMSVNVGVVLLVGVRQDSIHPMQSLELFGFEWFATGMDNVVILSLYQTMTCKQRFR